MQPARLARLNALIAEVAARNEFQRGRLDGVSAGSLADLREDPAGQEG